MSREKEIKAFVPEEYWSINGEFLKGKDCFEGSFYGIDNKKMELTSKTEVDEVLNQMDGNTFIVESVTKKERRRNPAVPFTTSSLQQEAARKLNFRAKKTMMLAQQLYEGIDLGKEGTVGLITYMRTDSTRISEIAKAEASEYIESTYGSEYVQKDQRKEKKNSNAQDAHEAIRPTSTLKVPNSLKEFLSRDQLRLYKLIWERFVASQMSPAVMDTMSVDLKNGELFLELQAQK